MMIDSRRAFGLALILTFAFSGLAHAELKVGDTAPNFILPGSDGKTYSLADYQGKKPVVIAWFPKAFTGGCTKECSALRASAIDTPFTFTSPTGRTFDIAASKGSGLDKYDVAYFTASCDTVDTNKKYAEELKLDYPVLSDPGRDVAKAYGVVHEGRAVPERWTFFVNEDGKIAHIDKKVSTGSHGADIAARLDELGVPKKD